MANVDDRIGGDHNIAAFRGVAALQLKRLIELYKSKLQFEIAAFYAEKLYSLNDDCETLLIYCECLYMSQRYKTVIGILRKSKYLVESLRCRYIMALSHFECQEYDEACSVLDFDKTSDVQNVFAKPLSAEDSRYQAEVYLLRGKICEAMKNSSSAAECYKLALQFDNCCFEAFSRLTRNRLLTLSEEREFLNNLPFIHKTSANKAGVDLIKYLYELNHPYLTSPNTDDVQFFSNLFGKNPDVILRKAKRCLELCQFQECYNLCDKIISQDPYHWPTMILLIAAMVELKKKNDLFTLGHELVKEFPDKAISWYAVGCYYLCIGSNDNARQFLKKATSMDAAFGEGWIALGHAYAADSEHDQAISSYFTASKILRGSHLPFLYVGLEYSITNNLRLAEKFFTEALNIKPDDPTLLHELGVVFYHMRFFLEAEKSFLNALSQVENEPDLCLERYWEPIYNNLGHVYRRMGRYDVALQYYEKALSLSPKNNSTLTSIGVVHALMGDFSKAFTSLHGSMWYKKDKVVVNHLLDKITNLMIENNLHPRLKETMQAVPIEERNPASDFPIAESSAVHFLNLARSASEQQLEDNWLNSDPGDVLDVCSEDVNMK